MKQKLLSLCMTAALCAGLLTLPAAAVSGPTWAEPALSRWESCGKLDAGVDAGQVVRRSEADGLIARVLGRDPSATLERPEDLLTRQELAVLTVRAFGLTESGGASYLDASSIAPEALEAVAILQNKGVMQGNEGMFRPMDHATYAEVIQTLYNAVKTTAPITGVSVRPRNTPGILTAGQLAQVNDGKFELTSVEKTAEGYAVALKGLAPLVGEKAGEMELGQPEKDGKWMGLQVQFHGLVRADEMQYSRDRETWTAFEANPIFTGSGAVDSAMIYVSATQEPDAQGPEVEKTTVFYVRNGENGQQFRFEVRYTPA